MIDFKAKNNVVLIVDDSPESLTMLNDALESDGMTTLVALEGRQAITIAQKIIPDVILLDAIMPNMDGFETCRQLKCIDVLKNIPVIFMTGLSDTDSIVNGLASGGVDYLTKPINPHELIARINVHIHNAKTTLSAQSALDSVGQNILAVDSFGKKLWATPAVNALFDDMSGNVDSDVVLQQVKLWLDHRPREGDRIQLLKSNRTYTGIYIGRAVDGEYLIRIVDDIDVDEAAVLRDNFDVTVRESQVFLWVAKGKTNREIAQIIEMSPRTVNKHLEQIFKKLGVDNRTSAAAIAIECLQKNGAR